MANDLNIILGAMLDTTAKSKKQLNAQIALLQEQLKPLRLKVNFDSNVFKQLQIAIKKLGDIEIKAETKGVKKAKKDVEDLDKIKKESEERERKFRVKSQAQFDKAVNSVKKYQVVSKETSKITDTANKKVIKENEKITKQYVEKGKVLKRVVELQRTFNEDGSKNRGVLKVKDSEKIFGDAERIKKMQEEIELYQKRNSMEKFDKTYSTNSKGITTETIKFRDKNTNEEYIYTKKINEENNKVIDITRKIIKNEQRITKELKKQEEIKAKNLEKDIKKAERQAYAEKARREAKEARDMENAERQAYAEKARREADAQKRLQAQRDEFNRRNLNSIDFEIQRREEASRIESQRIRSQMEQAERLRREQAERLKRDEDEAYRENARRNNINRINNNVRMAQTDFNNSGDRFRSNYGGYYDESKLKEILNVQRRIDNIIRQNGHNWELISAEIRRSRQELRAFENATRSARSQIQALEQSTTKIGDSIKRYATQFAVWESMAMGQMAVRDMVRTVIELDDAMVQLKKVTDETDLTYGKFQQTAFETAGKLGVTTKEFMDASSEWARTGASLEDITNNLAKASTVYSKVGDNIDTVTATQVLVSTMQGFNIEAEKSMEIVDVLNNLSNKYAVSSDGLGEALKRSASSMNVANTSLEETVALATTAHVVVQDASQIGNALKTVSINILVA